VTSCCFCTSDAREASIAEHAETLSASPTAITLRAFDERIFFIFPVDLLFEVNYSRARVDVYSRCPKLHSYSIEWYVWARDRVTSDRCARGGRGDPCTQCPCGGSSAKSRGRYFALGLSEGSTLLSFFVLLRWVKESTTGCRNAKSYSGEVGGAVGGILWTDNIPA